MFSTSWPGFLQLLVDSVVSLQRCDVEAMKSLSKSIFCQSDNLKMTLSRVKMHFQGFSWHAPPVFYLRLSWNQDVVLLSCLHELNSTAMCVKSAISGHVFLPRIKWHIFVGWTRYCIASFCNKMLLYIVKDQPVCNRNLCGYCQTNNCPNGEKKNHCVVNKNIILLHMVNSNDIISTQVSAQILKKRAASCREIYIFVLSRTNIPCSKATWQPCEC